MDLKTVFQFLMMGALVGRWAVDSTAAHAEKLPVEIRVMHYDQTTTIERSIDELTRDYVADLAADERNLRNGALVVTERGFEISGVLIIVLPELPEKFLLEMQSTLRRIFVDGAPWRGTTYRFTVGKVGFTNDQRRAVHRTNEIWDHSDRGDAASYDDVCEVWLTRLN